MHPPNQKPVVAIIGSPNVGKSTLFNRIVGRREAIVDKQSGVTRDRFYRDVEWNGFQFTLVDTGGYISEKGGELIEAVKYQTRFAIHEADLLLFVGDGRQGLTSSDSELADLIRKSGKEYILIVNKIDTHSQEISVNDFYALGVKSITTVSALEGRKIGDLLDMVISHLAKPLSEQSFESPRLRRAYLRTGSFGSQDKESKNVHDIRVAIVGMPNVGKSSLVNALLGQEQCIVTQTPGTTRDAIDVGLQCDNQAFTLVDTAGLRRLSKITDRIEYYSLLRTQKAVHSAHVVVVILDALKGFTKQDRQIIAYGIQEEKGIVVVVNKWDMIEERANAQEEFSEAIKQSFQALKFYLILFVSAKTKLGISKILPVCREVYDRRCQKIPTSALNNVLRQTISRYSPPAVRGKRIKIKYVTQVSQSPPRFVYFSNFPNLIPVSYRNYLENQFRGSFDFTGVPIKLEFRRS